MFNMLRKNENFFVETEVLFGKSAKQFGMFERLKMFKHLCDTVSAKKDLFSCKKSLVWNWNTKITRVKTVQEKVLVATPSSIWKTQFFTPHSLKLKILFFNLNPMYHGVLTIEDPLYGLAGPL